MTAWENEWRISEKGRCAYSIMSKPSTSTWFMNSKLNRKGIVFINRIIANHTLCASSLQRFNMVNDPVCECQQNYETVQHKIFECEMCDRESREEMLSELKKSGLSHAKDIRDILAISLKKKEFNALKAICEFIIHNNIAI